MCRSARVFRAGSGFRHLNRASHVNRCSQFACFAIQDRCKGHRVVPSDQAFVSLGTTTNRGWHPFERSNKSAATWRLRARFESANRRPSKDPVCIVFADRCNWQSSGQPCGYVSTPLINGPGVCAADVTKAGRGPRWIGPRPQPRSLNCPGPGRIRNPDRRWVTILSYIIILFSLVTGIGDARQWYHASVYSCGELLCPICLYLNWVGLIAVGDGLHPISK